MHEVALSFPEGYGFLMLKCGSPTKGCGFDIFEVWVMIKRCIV
jgi:hypothetical protein